MVLQLEMCLLNELMAGYTDEWTCVKASVVPCEQATRGRDSRVPGSILATLLFGRFRMKMLGEEVSIQGKGRRGGPRWEMPGCPLASLTSYPPGCCRVTSR